MPDAAFANPRLAALYDVVEAGRDDLELYAELVDELEARSVLDVGCGTGSFVCLLAARGKLVVGVDPAEASLAIARRKPFAEHVQWLHGDATTVGPLRADVATMTGNVAQVFLTAEAWARTLEAIHAALGPARHLVFESRDPAKEAWLAWNRDDSITTIAVPREGAVTSWVDLTEVKLPFVSFRWTFRFERTGDELTSTSTLRFRNRAEIEASLAAAGFAVLEVRDATDRPGLEHVFIAGRAV